MARLRFGLLGALEVTSDGVRLPLGGNRRSRLLAVVLVEADRVVPLPRLIDAVWDEQPPPTARTQVHKIVLGLRRLLGRMYHNANRCVTVVGLPIDLPRVRARARRT